jgi:hypothetical protein
VAHPALPEDHQAPHKSSRVTTDHVCDVIGGLRIGDFPFLTNRFASGFATPERVSPVFSSSPVLQTG